MKNILSLQFLPGGTLWTVAQRRETEADLGSLAELKRPSLDFREPEAAGIGGLEQMREENYTTPPQKNLQKSSQDSLIYW